jgi:hypothetical protein
MTNTDLADLWRQYQELGQRWQSTSDDAMGELVDAERAIADQIEAADPHDLAGIIIQTRLLADLTEHQRPTDFARAIVARLERLARLLDQAASGAGPGG